MKLTMERAGRVVIPKPLRDGLGLPDGGEIEISIYGAGLQLVPSGPTARLVEKDGHLVAESETVVDDEMVFALIDSGRR